MALRLYRRAVLRWPWQKIANEEAADGTADTAGYDTGAIRQSVEEWAEALAIELPGIPRGRPRKKK